MGHGNHRRKNIRRHRVDIPSGDIHVIRLDAVFCHEITTPPAINDLVAAGQGPGIRPGPHQGRHRSRDPGQGFQNRLAGQDPAETGPGGTASRFLRYRCATGSAMPFSRKRLSSARDTPSSWAIRTPAPTGPSAPLPPAWAPPTWRWASSKGSAPSKRRKPCASTSPAACPEGVYAKDVILSVIGRIGVNGATNKVIEFAGPVVAAMDMEARMTLCNMAIEAGGTCGICAPDRVTWTTCGPLSRMTTTTPEAALAAFRLPAGRRRRYDQPSSTTM
jgi:3-isopropylmalate/(R)-2-methylmalate dehydratase large subunit